MITTIEEMFEEWWREYLGEGAFIVDQEVKELCKAAFYAGRRSTDE